MHCGPAVKKDHQGFTMAELIVVIAVLSILAVTILLNVNNLKASWGLNTATRNMLSDFNLAKSYAVKEGINCVLQFTNDGYHIFQDKNQDFSMDSGETEYKVVYWSQYMGGLSSSNNFSANAVAFRPDGFTAASGGGFGGGTIIITNETGSQLRVIISAYGTARIE